MHIDRAVIEIQGGCNYTCQMCPQTHPDGTTGARGKDWMRKMPLKEFEDYVAQCAEAGLNVVNLDGSGEATISLDLPEYIAVVKKYGAQAVIFSNGYRMNGNFMQECVDAGLDFFRFSIVGYNYDTYKEWMNSDNFYRVISNLHEMKRYVVRTKSDCTVATYHLILDNENIDYEVAFVVEFPITGFDLLLEDYALMLYEDGGYVVADTTPNYVENDRHTHSLSEWDEAWQRERQQGIPFPAILVPLATQP